MSEIFLNTVGLNNCLGDDVLSVREKLFSNAQSGLVPSEKLISGRTTWVGRVQGQLPEIPARLAHYSCRNNRLILGAYAQISDSVAYFIEKYGPKRVAVILGTSTSGIAEGEKEYQKFSGGFKEKVQYSRQEIGNCSLFLADYLGLTGIRYTVSTACASSKKAFASAKRLLDANLCDAVIVGGSDSLCALTLNGFDSLDSVSPEVCNPFSRNRSGINIGEGAALFVMSREPAEVRILGVGESSDGYHISSPDPSGKGAEIAISAALRDAKIQAFDVGYINLHGTATIKNDEMESRVVNQIFGSHVPASSTKPMIGHTLGAAGAQELAFCYMTLSAQLNPQRKLPIHHWDGEADNTLAPDPTRDKSGFFGEEYLSESVLCFWREQCVGYFGSELMSLKLQDYVPHRPPMILLSEIVSVDELGSICEVTITEESMFCENGEVPGWVGIEYMAQTIAVYGGFLSRQNGQGPGIGFLLGARKYVSRQSGFKLGETLVVRAQPVLIDGDMGCFKASISVGDSEVAEATIMTYKASEEVLKKMVFQE